jgi:hypothetical protein
MSATRVYVPSSWTGLRSLVTNDGIGPAPFLGHAVTEALRAAYPEGGEEELEYAAMTAAARTSLGLVAEGDPARRVVVAVDAGTVLPAGDDDPTVVEVAEVVPFRDVASVLVDDEEAQAEVAAAVEQWSAAEAGDPEAEVAVDRCLDLDLAWYAAQEIGDLLAQ